MARLKLILIAISLMKTFLEIMINSKTDMRRFGVFLAKTLNAGDVVTLNGSVGVGRTFLFKAIIKKIKKTNKIPTPTFNT